MLDLAVASCRKGFKAEEAHRDGRFFRPFTPMITLMTQFELLESRKL